MKKIILYIPIFLSYQFFHYNFNLFEILDLNKVVATLTCTCRRTGARGSSTRKRSRTKCCNSPRPRAPWPSVAAPHPPGCATTAPRSGWGSASRRRKMTGETWNWAPCARRASTAARVLRRSVSTGARTGFLPAPGTETQSWASSNSPWKALLVWQLRMRLAIDTHRSSRNNTSSWVNLLLLGWPAAELSIELICCQSTEFVKYYHWTAVSDSVIRTQYSKNIRRRSLIITSTMLELCTRLLRLWRKPPAPGTLCRSTRRVASELPWSMSTGISSCHSTAREINIQPTFIPTDLRARTALLLNYLWNFPDSKECFAFSPDFKLWNFETFLVRKKIKRSSWYSSTATFSWPMPASWESRTRTSAYMIYPDISPTRPITKSWQG